MISCGISFKAGESERQVIKELTLLLSGIDLAQTRERAWWRRAAFTVALV